MDYVKGITHKCTTTVLCMPLLVMTCLLLMFYLVECILVILIPGTVQVKSDTSVLRLVLCLTRAGHIWVMLYTHLHCPRHEWGRWWFNRRSDGRSKMVDVFPQLKLRHCGRAWISWNVLMSKSSGEVASNAAAAPWSWEGIANFRTCAQLVCTEWLHVLSFFEIMA